MPIPVLVLATGNPGKAKEVQALLQTVQVKTLADFPKIEMPPEDKPDFAGNAQVKAEHVAGVLNCAVLADDSGLVVDALDGAPGVYSARYAPGTDADRYRKLLVALESVPDNLRTARFCCAMAFAVPGKPTQVTEGACEGTIARSDRGQGGFGYDPVFVVGPEGRSMAELSSAEKNAISHRGAALKGMADRLAGHFSLEIVAVKVDGAPPAADK